MPRFKWNDPKRGRVLNKYIDTICRDFPAIAKDVVKHGIGDLDSWFSNDDDDHDYYLAKCGSAKCGCLVGTTALVAVSRYPAAARKAGVEGEHNGAKALYNLIVAKTKRDTSKYELPNEFFDNSNRVDPLYRLISDAGEYAAAESYQDGMDPEERQKQVIDHFEHRIRKNLGIPYPKARKHAQAQAV